MNIEERICIRHEPEHIFYFKSIQHNMITLLYRAVKVIDKPHRALRDGSSSRRIPGNELPGYDHLVATRRANAHAVHSLRKRWGLELTSPHRSVLPVDA